VQATAGDDRALQINWCYRLTFGRPPTSDEQAEVTAFLSQGDASTSLALFCLAMFNASEFVMLE
jgi:hypothetical protein